MLNGFGPHERANSFTAAAQSADCTKTLADSNAQRPGVFDGINHRLEGLVGSIGGANARIAALVERLQGPQPAANSGPASNVVQSFPVGKAFATARRIEELEAISRELHAYIEILESLG